MQSANWGDVMSTAVDGGLTGSIQVRVFIGVFAFRLGKISSPDLKTLRLDQDFYHVQT